jgi:hypothetical protein
MPTTVELCNAALLKLGAEPIATLDDASVEADFARRLYPFVRDGLMVAHPWSFTLATARLEADAEPPLAEFSHSFTLPGDHLRTLSAGVGQSARGLTYRIQGSKLLAGAQSIVLGYQRRVGEAMFPAFFVQALVARLAAELCIPLTEGTSRAAELVDLAELDLRRARLVDSQQSTPRAIEDFTLIEARY